MSGSFTVGALAVAAREANAVGAVRLTLLPRRLEIELLRAGSFSDGYVPGGLTRFVRFSVPYSAVRGLVRKNRGVVLSLDPAAATPYSRFFLTHFTDLPLEALASVHRRRSVARALAWLLPLPFAAWAALRAPEAVVSGTLGRASLAVVVAVATTVSLVTVAGWIEIGGPLSRRLRDALERKLAQRMGFEPLSFHETDPFELPEVDEHYTPAPQRILDIPIELAPLIEPAPIEPAPIEPAPIGSEPMVLAAPVPGPPAATLGASVPVLPAVALVAPAPVVHAPPLPVYTPTVTLEARSRRTRVLTAVFASAAVLVGLAGYRWIDRWRPAPSAAEAAGAPGPVEEADAPTSGEPDAEAGREPPSNEPGADDAPSSTIDASKSEPVSTLAACTCERSDSPLWRTGLPALSMIPIPKTTRGKTAESIAPVADEEGVSWYEFDVAVVNNAAVSLRDVRVVVTFARRNSRGERVGATDRGLFWEGELGPARSVKWSVDGPGTEVKIEIEEQRMLREVGPASADAFAKLLRARQPSVRLHGAMMLAYLGDPRAVAAENELTDLSQTDTITRARIARAASPLRVCDVTFTEDGTLDACAYNGTEAALASPSIAEVVEMPTGGATRRSVPIGESIGPKAGKKVSLVFGAEADELQLVTE